MTGPGNGKVDGGGPIARYGVGMGTAVTGPGGAALVDGGPDDELTTTISDAIHAGDSVAGALGRLFALGLDDLGSFGLALLEGPRVHLVLRGEVRVLATRRDGTTVEGSGVGMSSWNEVVVDDLATVIISLGAVNATESLPFVLRLGTAPAGSLQLDLMESAETAAPDTPSPHRVVELEDDLAALTPPPPAPEEPGSVALDVDAAEPTVPIDEPSPGPGPFAAAPQDEPIGPGDEPNLDQVEDATEEFETSDEPLEEPEAPDGDVDEPEVWPPPPPESGSALDEAFGDLLGATRSWHRSGQSSAPGANDESPAATSPGPSSPFTEDPGPEPTVAPDNAPSIEPSTVAWIDEADLVQKGPTVEVEREMGGLGPAQPADQAPAPARPPNGPVPGFHDGAPSGTPPVPSTGSSGLITGPPSWAPGPPAPAPEKIEPPPPVPPRPPSGSASVDPLDDQPTIARHHAQRIAPASGSQPTVQAVHCPVGHPNPTHANGCRRCGAPISNRTIVNLPRPPLGTLRFPDGTVVVLDSPLLLGRKPSATTSGPDVRAVAIADPEHSLSRSHLEIRISDWHVQVVDRDSMNGTFVSAPGREPFRLHPGEAHPIPVGTVVAMGDSITFTFDPNPEP